MRGGKHRPVPPDDGLDGQAILDVVRLRLLRALGEEAGMKLEEMQDRERCECGRAVVCRRPDDGLKLPCPAPGCPTRRSTIDVQLLSLETREGARLAYVRRGGRLPGGEPLFWWEPDDKPAQVR